jgi:cysteinyl-tRNA synthetase
VRFHLLRSHYRSVSDFADDALTASAQGLQRLRQGYAAWRAAPAAAPNADAWRDGARALRGFHGRRPAHPEAIAVLFDVAREANRALERGDHGTVHAAADLYDELLDGVLGVPPAAAADDGSLMAGVTELLLEQRQAARKRRDFASADAIRDRLASSGSWWRTRPDGARWRRSG